MPESAVGNGQYAFVSYAHADDDVVQAEMARIRSLGYRVWYDDGIAPGSEWSDSLAQHIEECSLFLFLVSPRSVASDHCRRELAFALERKRPVLAVHLEDTELPGAVGLSLGNRQAILKHRLSGARYEAQLSQALEDALGFPAATDGPRSDPEPLRVWARRPAATRLFRGFVVAAALVAVALVLHLFSRNAVVPQSEEDAATGVSIAVLPFENLSGDPNQEYLSEGIAEDILNELVRSAELLVRPRSSSFRFRSSDLDGPAIGTALAVTHLLEGSVRRFGERVRVNVQLIEVDTNTTLWSARYTEQLSNIIETQDAIATRICTELNTQLRVRPRTIASAEAYEALLQARYFYSRAQSDAAHEWYLQETHLDANNADAWAELARLEYHLVSVNYFFRQRQLFLSFPARGRSELIRRPAR